MQALSRRAGRLAKQIRGYAAQADVVSAEQSPFLRFGSPFPAQINMNPALAQLPDTQVIYFYEFLSKIRFYILFSLILFLIIRADYSPP